MKSYVIIGLGRFGTRLAEKLYEYGEDVLAIDTDAQIVNKIADRVTKAVIGDAKDKQTLENLDVAKCDCAVVSIGSDLSASVLITMNLKSLGVPYIICKAQDSTHREILLKLGADRVIIPEKAVADKIATSLSGKNILEYIDLSKDTGIVEINSPATWNGKTIRELSVREKYGVTIIAVKNNNEINVSPSAECKIKKDSILVLLGDYLSIDKIKNM